MDIGVNGHGSQKEEKTWAKRQRGLARLALVNSPFIILPLYGLLFYLVSSLSSFFFFLRIQANIILSLSLSLYL